MTNTRAIVAAGHEVTADACAVALSEGGNAFDAAIAGLAAAMVAEPVLASLGGGGHLLAVPAHGRARVYDFFVDTPRRKRPQGELEFGPIHCNFGTAKQEFHIGRGSAAVPGVVRGLFQVHRDLARLPLKQLFEPAVRAARDGLIIDSLSSYIFSVVGDIYVSTPQAQSIYASVDQPDRMVGEGERLRQPDLAGLLEVLAIEGEDLFYRGEIATSIVEDMRQGGLLEARDLSEYQCHQRAPLELSFRGRQLLTNPPPSSGGTLIAFGLAILERSGRNLKTARFGSAEHLNCLARIMNLTSEARLAALAQGSGDLKLEPELLAHHAQRLLGKPKSTRGTTHLSVIDEHQNMASLSLSNGEGCGYIVPGTGIMLNNMLGESDLNPAGLDSWQPGVRMTSMMSPSVMRSPQGQTFVTGSGGSNRIRTAILQVLLNLVEFGMDVPDAVAAPRIHYEAGLLSAEAGFDESPLAELFETYPNHQVWPDQNLFFGGTHTVASSGKDLIGAGDPRRGGVVRQT